MSNDMRDRLTELLGDYLYSEQIADYLIANGVILPPCKAGDLLFCIMSDKNIDKVYRHIEACRIEEIICLMGGGFVFGVKEINNHYWHNVSLGKDAFKTFEEAEKALKERENK